MTVPAGWRVGEGNRDGVEAGRQDRWRHTGAPVKEVEGSDWDSIMGSDEVVQFWV